MDKKRRRKKLYAMILGTAMTVASFSYVVMAASGEPGSTEDPIVTQGYVEQRNEQLKFYIDQKMEEMKTAIEEIKGTSNTPVPSSGTSFIVVQVMAGQKIIGGEGSELILRAGEATAIDSPSGGVANVTKGKDLKMGEEVGLNHLLLIPRNDGRGMQARSDLYVMVKGTYSIQ